jgi:predicted NUDIX family NTP pyrophosphohydrolase
MPKRSAGILMFRRRGPEVEVLLMHPGGPFWAKKDVGAWSIPKGEYSEGEDALAVAKREFEEETGAVRRAISLPSVRSFKPAARSSPPGDSRAISIPRR